MTRLSPSRIVTIRRGTPSRRKMAVAATASGGATIAPSAKRRREPHLRDSVLDDDADDGGREQHQPDRQQQRSAAAFALKSRIGVKYAAANRIGGRSSRKTTSGSSSIVGEIRAGGPGPARRGRAGSGRRRASRRARYARATATTNRPRTSSIGLELDRQVQRRRRSAGSGAVGRLRRPRRDACAPGTPVIEARQLERLEVVGRLEAEDLRPGTTARASSVRRMRVRAAEPVALALEREVGVRDRRSPRAPRRSPRPATGRHDPVVEALEDQHRARDLVEVVDRRSLAIERGGLRDTARPVDRCSATRTCACPARGARGRRRRSG